MRAWIDNEEIPLERLRWAHLRRPEFRWTETDEPLPTEVFNRLQFQADQSNAFLRELFAYEDLPWWKKLFARLPQPPGD